ncbi:MAG: hypothetical protein RIR62_1501 [Pseudomonadota bacterium]
MDQQKDAAPQVSVIIAAWRAADRIGTAIASALSQTGVTVEVVVADDASPDGTAAVIAALAEGDGRIRPIYLPANAGPAAARNRAIAAARGEWIAVLDADDRMVPRRLSRMVALAREKGADCILGNLAEVDADGMSLSDHPFAVTPEEPAPVTAEGFVAANLAQAGPRRWGYLKPLIRRQALADHALAYDETLRNGEDFHLILSLLLSGARVWFSPDPDYLYTRRAGSVSDRIALSHLAALLAADARVAARLAQRPALAALMRRRQAELSDLMTAETVLRAIRARQAGQARRALAARPRALGLVLRQAGEGALRRLSRLRGRPRARHRDQSGLSP